MKADYTGVMAQLTKQDVAEVVEEVLDRKLEEKLDKKLDEKFDEKLGLQAGEALDRKLDGRFAAYDQKMDQRFATFKEDMERQMGFFIEHVDDKFDSLAEAFSVVNDNMRGLAKQSDLNDVKQDTKTIKRAVKETNHDLTRLENRFDSFERAYI